MEDQSVVTSDDQKLGTVVAERDNCVVIETGHIFKTKHAIPREFLHEVDGVLRATVTKDIVSDSPKVDLEHWDLGAVRPALRPRRAVRGRSRCGRSRERRDRRAAGGREAGAGGAAATLGGENDPTAMPAIRERQANASNRRRHGEPERPHTDRPSKLARRTAARGTRRATSTSTSASLVVRSSS